MRKEEREKKKKKKRKTKKKVKQCVTSKKKQNISGMKEQYSAGEMVGKKMMVSVNLKPAKLAGVLSEGMLLCAENEKGELALLIPEKEIPSGAEIC